MREWNIAAISEILMKMQREMKPRMYAALKRGDARRKRQAIDGAAAARLMKSMCVTEAVWRILKIARVLARRRAHSRGAVMINKENHVITRK